jgi:hypothetical protein
VAVVAEELAVAQLVVAQLVEQAMQALPVQRLELPRLEVQRSETRQRQQQNRGPRPHRSSLPTLPRKLSRTRAPIISTRAAPPTLFWNT